MTEVRLEKVALDHCYTVAFVDSAGGRVAPKGKSNNQRSRSAIVVCAQDDLTRVFVRKAWPRYCTTDELCDEIFATQERFKPAVFGADATATQGLFIDALVREAREKGKKLPISKVVLGTDKDFRIETTIQPVQAAGRLFVMKEAMEDLKMEYDSFPGSRFKDLVDALAGCISLLPHRPTGAELNDEVDQYRAYLQTMRVPEQEIDERVAKAFNLADSSTLG